MLNPRDYIDELRAQHEARERSDAVTTATAALRSQLTRLDAWAAAQVARLASDEQKRTRALRRLGERPRRLEDERREDAIRAAMDRIVAERAEVERRRESGEAIRVLQYMDAMGIDRKLLVGLGKKRAAMADKQSKRGAPPVSTVERQQRAKIAAALSVLAFHGWRLDEAAAQVARELKGRGVALAPAWSKRHRRDLKASEQIIEYRRDLKVRTWEKAAKQTRPQSWDAALAATARSDRDSPPPHVMSAPMGAPGLLELPRPEVLAQSYFDRLAWLTEWHYAAQLGDGVPMREAALRAAHFALDLADSVSLKSR